MRIRSILSFPLIVIVKFYQYVISPLKPPTCRHIPTCSQYAMDALKMHGSVRGSQLAVKRIARCHPWGSSGFDPVPKILVKKLHLGHYPKTDLLKQK